MVTQNCHLFLDINECELYPNLCKGGGLCVNTQGSFRCNCPPGLILDSSGTQCVGKLYLSLNILHFIGSIITECEFVF